jgi:hypothetical protein
MDIYFDSGKKAYAFPIPDPLAMTDLATWLTYADYPCGEAWDIIDGQFVPLKSPEELQTDKDRAQKLSEREMAFETVDWRVWRHEDQVSAGLTPTDDRDSLA